jgi:hypothetical protein
MLGTLTRGPSFAPLASTRPAQSWRSTRAGAGRGAPASAASAGDARLERSVERPAAHRRARPHRHSVGPRLRSRARGPRGRVARGRPARPPCRTIGIARDRYSTPIHRCARQAGGPRRAARRPRPRPDPRQLRPRPRPDPRQLLAHELSLPGTRRGHQRAVAESGRGEEVLRLPASGRIGLCRTILRS